MAIEFEETREALTPLEYVIHLGTLGSHVLFDNDRIRAAFTRGEGELAYIGSEHVEEVRDAIRRILAIPEFESKKDFIQTLPAEIQDVIIYLYFQMIERTMHSTQAIRH